MPDSPNNENTWLSGTNKEPANDQKPAESPNPTGEIPQYISDYHATQSPPTIIEHQPSNPQPVENKPSSYPLPTPPSPGRPLKKRYILTLVILLILIGIGGGSVYYKYFYLDSLDAPRQLYLASVNNKTGQFTLDASVTPGSSATFNFGTITFSASGSYDSTDPNNPKLNVTVKGAIAKSKFAGKLLETDSFVYLKLTDVEILQTLGIKIPSTWYKIPTPASKEIKSCDYSKLKNPGTTLDQLSGRLVPLKNTSRVGTLETVAGHQTTHFFGELDTTKLGAYVKALNGQLSNDCKINLEPDDYQDLSLSYDIWMGSDFDRIKITLNNSKDNSKFYLSSDLSDFNKQFDFTPPTGAKDFQQLPQDLKIPSSLPTNLNPSSLPIF